MDVVASALKQTDKLVLIQSHTFLGFLMSDSKDMVAGIFKCFLPLLIRHIIRHIVYFSILMHLYYLSKSFDPPVILYSDTLYNLFFSSFTYSIPFGVIHRFSAYFILGCGSPRIGTIITPSM